MFIVARSGGFAAEEGARVEPERGALVLCVSGQLRLSRHFPRRRCTPRLGPGTSNSSLKSSHNIIPVFMNWVGDYDGAMIGIAGDRSVACRPSTSRKGRDWSFAAPSFSICLMPFFFSYNIPFSYECSICPTWATGRCSWRGSSTSCRQCVQSSRSSLCATSSAASRPISSLWYFSLVSRLSYSFLCPFTLVEVARHERGREQSSVGIKFPPPLCRASRLTSCLISILSMFLFPIPFLS